MRLKIVTILIICAGILYSCAKNTEKSVKESTVTNKYDYFGTIEEFEYKGHEYIRFQHSFGRSGTCGVVHNPDCKSCKIYYDSI